MANSDREMVEMAFDAFAREDLDAALDLVRSGQRGRGKPSGIEVDQDLLPVFRIRDGKFVEYRIYAERAEALESIGVTD